MRLDKFLVESLKENRNQVQNLIKKGCVKVNGVVVTKSGFKIKSSDKIDIEPIEEEKSYKNVDFEIDILYEDDDLLVVNKPPFLVVHPAPSVKEATLVDWLKEKGFKLSNIAGEDRFGIVHRIDKETSGALVIAKNNRAHQFLSEQLKDKSMGRYYIMLLNQSLKDITCVDKPIGRNPKNRLKMGVVNGGKSAKTMFVPIYKNLTAAKLFTGRTHQIRVHLKSINRYIIGDRLYGKDDKQANRVMLHAQKIYFTHLNGKKLSIIAPIFDDFRNLLPEGFENEKIDSISDVFDNVNGMCN